MENYENFLTPEDDFKLAMETYLPEFLQRMDNDTMREPEFVQRTVKMMELAESVGIDLQQYILDYGKINGIE
ncbi:MAG: hypothetical protein K2J47_09205 [Ruminococcus sp.]|nr:hypothetical protein [Ruminococcus sp.]MDE6789480.1 hypothetical protein [Ruminococcus sp.]